MECGRTKGIKIHPTMPTRNLCCICLANLMPNRQQSSHALSTAPAVVSISTLLRVLPLLVENCPSRREVHALNNKTIVSRALPSSLRPLANTSANGLIHDNQTMTTHSFTFHFLESLHILECLHGASDGPCRGQTVRFFARPAAPPQVQRR